MHKLIESSYLRFPVNNWADFAIYVYSGIEEYWQKQERRGDNRGENTPIGSCAVN